MLIKNLKDKTYFLAPEGKLLQELIGFMQLCMKVEIYILQVWFGFETKFNPDKECMDACIFIYMNLGTAN